MENLTEINLKNGKKVIIKLGSKKYLLSNFDDVLNIKALTKDFS